MSAESIDTSEATLDWSRFDAIAIRTTSDGPFDDDVFWEFASRDGRTLSLPSRALSSEFMTTLNAMCPGCDAMNIIRAMGCSTERLFYVWERNRSENRPDRDALAKRFTDLAHRAGADAAEAEKTAATLLDAWAGVDRHYHDVAHLVDCLDALDALSASDANAWTAETLLRAELALWYHDAVYLPLAGDSEERSARMLLEDLARLGVDAELAGDAARLVRATQHLGRPAAATLAPDEALVVDIDLAILGRHPFRFVDFEYAVTEEYAKVPRPIYLWKRRKFLRSLLASPQIFHTDVMRDQFEAPARANIKALLSGPRYSGWRWLFT
ncbi:MAG: hypothetical protein R3F39_09150 [Myxococcota bacterium]